MSKKGKQLRARRWLDEFKEFATRGNVIDLAVGVIIGGAFGKITTSLVNDVFMPVIGKLLGSKSFMAWQIILVGGEEPVTINIGTFISAIVDFLLIAFCVFIFVKLINAMRRKKAEEPEQPPAPPEPPADIALLTEIRDLLKEREK